MRELRNGLVLIAVVVLGALVTWRWTHRDAEPVARAGVETANVERPIPKTQAMPESSLPPSPGNSSEPPKSVPAAAAPSADLSAPARDDSTYYRLLATIQALPRGADHARTITELHESIVDAPDDPEWTRAMERKLRENYSELEKGGRFALTSVVCRSTGCEVQALGPRIERRTDSAGEETPAPEPFPQDRPVGPLSRPGPVLYVDLGDSMGYLAIFRRGPLITQ